MIHETVFCNNPNREYKKSALVGARNGQENRVNKHYINDTTRYR